MTTMRTQKFYDFNVHTTPECEDPPEEMAKTASRYGYAGIAITNHTPHQPQIPDHAKIPVYSGIEIVAKNPSHLRQMIRKHRTKVCVLAVHGGDERINRAALENPDVDILSHPNADSNGLNHVLMRLAAENRVAIEYNLDSIIETRGTRRVRALAGFRHNLKLARKYGAPVILTSNARSVYGLRAPGEMIALASLFGMTVEESVAALSTVPEEIIRRSSENWIMEGVEIVESQIG